mmetsp:Transcript_125687/g.350124  ORF Transcript_125687/g.350124 Transcript_125687/m.350124 type:complete len:452 (-) Transcript_125687:95-1450(-)
MLEGGSSEQPHLLPLLTIGCSPGTLNVTMDAGGPICRICFVGAGGDDEEGQQLVSPCRCEGSQKFVHLSCLRRWQRSVQLGGSNHPEDAAREDRHLICNVCKAPFSLPPQDRTSMMSDLACMRPEQVAPAMLLVTKKTDAEPLDMGSQVNLALRAFFETRAAHFRKAVYILTDVRPLEGSEAEGRRGSDVVLGANLSRALDAPDVSKLDGAAGEAELLACSRRGVEVLWLNGGPVRPRAVTCLACLEHLPHARRARLLSRHAVRELIAGERAVVEGPMPGVLAVAEEEAAAAAEAGCERRATVLAWAGFAQWNCTQLLGEIARGSWGWCYGTSDDVVAAAEAQRARSSAGLWDSLRYSDRLQWAPDNELSREFESRFPSRPPEGVPREPDPQAEAVGALVRQFEAIRRGGGSASSSHAGAARRSRSSGGASPEAGSAQQSRGSRSQTCVPQ